MKKILFFILLVVFFNLLLAYPWPMKNDSGNFDGPLSVSSTLGDLRDGG